MGFLIVHLFGQLRSNIPYRKGCTVFRLTIIQNNLKGDNDKHGDLNMPRYPRIELAGYLRLIEDSPNGWIQGTHGIKINYATLARMEARKYVKALISGAMPGDPERRCIRWVLTDRGRQTLAMRDVHIKLPEAVRASARTE